MRCRERAGTVQEGDGADRTARYGVEQSILVQNAEADVSENER
ncbi:hypothetical protein MOX02_33360 [Methylobacterium oxalidis]|uniref:Uncharacterized protein n=1 Tax=Methylobacterium oxalidis TaxID=944322 RepID=A0A512J5R0_9HYPH|nr:hypothetical protein MOX02_33360 [Methylobacterium oxalidis]GJE29999.1 hypothetical protein LDDCCGHA_0162 [Methylobacterium oxalidis]GLS64658.1 hypothetical protein GCM10007888_30390 [Methylobacterium oxalidis]